MNYQNNADDTRNQVQKYKTRLYSCFSIAVAVMMLFMIGCATHPPSAGRADASNSQAEGRMPEAVDAQLTDTGGDNIETPALPDSEPVSEATFPTFKNTGSDICTNEEGLPLIYLFSSSLCSHCEWGGGAYDFIVRYHTANGLIEAHHYDLLSGDDLLTEETETEIPAEMLELYKRGNPKDLVPYYNFGCAYDRIGNGYEKENDLVAEGEEMRRVIEALVRIVSKDQ